MSPMLRLDGKPIDGRLVPGHTWNADLIEFDGPLLSLFKSDEGDDVLYAWLDCSNSSNRWCIVPVSRDSLRDYLEQSLSLYDLFVRAPELIIFDVGLSARRHRFISTNWEKLPEAYLPDKTSYLTDEISTEAAKSFQREDTQSYFLGLDGEMYIDDLSAIPRTYQQLYSFHYGLEHLGRSAVQGTLSKLLKKWTGGFSAVNIFTGLRNVIPSIHRAQITELRYNSPGHIELNLLIELASKIEKAAEKIEQQDDFAVSEEYYRTVYRFFREHNIGGFEDERKLSTQKLSPEVSADLNLFVERFFQIMGWADYRGNFDALDANPLQQLRVLLAYYRRLRKLRPYIVQKKLLLGQSFLDA